MFFKTFFLFLLKVSIILCSKDVFKENLYLKNLPSGHVYAYFEFETLYNQEFSSLNYENHFDLFSSEIANFLNEKRVEEIYFSLSNGVWKTKQWGFPYRDTAPGIDINLWLKDYIKNPDLKWKEVTNYLSGKFCASIGNIDSKTSTHPKFLMRPKFNGKNLTHNYYASLPYESVCTENLTPWKKLLPCFSKSGLSSLLNSGLIFNNNYFSLSLDVHPFCIDESCSIKGASLKQTVSIVFNTLHKNSNKQNWSLIKLFGTPIKESCHLAKESRILVDITSDKLEEAKHLNPVYNQTIVKKVHLENRLFAVYDIKKIFSQSNKFNLANVFQNTHNFDNNFKNLINVKRSFTDEDFSKGIMKCQIENNLNLSFDIIYFETLPWYLRFYLHTLVIKNNKVDKMNHTILYYQPGKHKTKPYHLELKINLPENSVTIIEFKVDKAFLKWTEFPPDANHGIYVSSAIISAEKDKLNIKDNLKITTEPILINLPTPDFSMPYNVICLVCTVISLAFCPIHNFSTCLIKILKK